MSDERFDEHIRKQLESVKPPYHPEAWKNFQKLLPQPWYVTIYHQYTAWLYGGAAGLALLVTSLLYFGESNPDPALKDKPIALQDQAPENKDQVPGNEAPAAASPAPDTTSWPSPAPARSPGLEAPDTLPAASAGRAAPDSPPALAETPPAQPARPAPRPAAARKPAPPTKTRGRLLAETPAAPTNQDRAWPADTTAASGTAPTPGGLPAGLAPGSTGQQPLAATPARTDTLAAAALPAADSSTASWQVRIGPTAYIQHPGRLAGGVAGELLLGNRLGLSLGLLWRAPDRQLHLVSGDFQRHTGRPFEEYYRRHIPHHDRIEQIKIKTTLISLPLSASYYLPARGRLSFFVHGATILDLQAYQTVEFTSSFRGQTRTVRFEQKARPQTWHTILLGPGAQLRLGRLVGQVAPYVDLSFRDPDYFNRQGKWGLNTSLKWHLTP